MASANEICASFLNLYWLRPETVIWRSIDALKMQDIEFQKPILDLGCGDGTFSFVFHGGKTTVDFDIFTSITDSKNFFAGKDIFNHKQKVTPTIIKKPKLQIDVGIDIKKNLLLQANELNLYNKLLCCDLNKPLPLNNESFKTIFSNVFYWIQNIEKLLLECSRILTHDGRIILCVPDIRFRKNLIYNLFLQKQYSWAKALDRGIYSNVVHCLSFSQWKSLFKKHGFKIDFHANYLSERFIQFHNIGMRPYSPFLIEMANKLDPKIRKKIKSDLISELRPIIQSYVESELPEKHNNCFHLFVLKKM